MGSRTVRPVEQLCRRASLVRQLGKLYMVAQKRKNKTVGYI